MKGKEKCSTLKELRRRIAEANGIELNQTPCSHQGDCPGTCPKCDAELKHLEKELERGHALGKKLVLTGLTVGMALNLSGCDLLERMDVVLGRNTPQPEIDYIDGEVECFGPQIDPEIDWMGEVPEMIRVENDE